MSWKSRHTWVLVPLETMFHWLQSVTLFRLHWNVETIGFSWISAMWEHIYVYICSHIDIYNQNIIIAHSYRLSNNIFLFKYVTFFGHIPSTHLTLPHYILLTVPLPSSYLLTSKAPPFSGWTVLKLYAASNLNLDVALTTIGCQSKAPTAFLRRDHRKRNW